MIMSKIAIMADSGCQMQSHENIYIVPLQVTIGTKSYRDGIDIDSKRVFEMMAADASCMPKTSQPASGDIVATLEQIQKDGYEEVIAISIATGLSSTLSGMKMAAEMVGVPVTLIDSKGTAGNQRYLVQLAQRYVANGLSASDIQTRLLALIEKSATVIMAPNLDHLKRGGRITPAVAMLAGMLKIVPVMKLNMALGGRIDTLAKARTMKKALAVMVNDVVANGVTKDGYIITVEHVLCEEQARELVQKIREQFGEDTPIDFGLLPSVVGAHMGIGGMGFQYIPKAKDEAV